MEAIVSIACALGGLAVGLAFLCDFSRICCSDRRASRARWVWTAVKFLVAFLLLHFHFELDILD